ncbi:ribonuclease H-like protein [Macrolepiota fuliginosa MF-IS2]|uniref:ribonuclease H n=1 Tax=Macrolepiota fuliginosa MF-IS2 TaxID=1400762 RepID=A0A9P5XN51_9AGAR|nr:ribonuclease H-like protein [Macrolepiota fuliginosa MF-IS2]
MPKQNFYAVHQGREVGVFLTWAECEAQIKNYARAVFKKFSSAAEAEAFVKDGPSTTAPAQPSEVKSRGQKRTFGNVDDESQWTIVYSDGACKGNGQAAPVAGVGVYWGPNDQRNIAERCPGDQTNNRAELIAIIRVLETAPVERNKLLIKTDSQYSINCFKQWLPTWRENNFLTSTGSSPKNIGIIKYLSALLKERGRRGQQVLLQHVKGHSGDPGNDGADAQANIGTTFPPQPDFDWESLEARTSETIDTLIETMPDQPIIAQEREVKESIAPSPRRLAKIPKNTPSTSVGLSAEMPPSFPGRSPSKSRVPVAAPTRPPRSPFRPVAPKPGTNSDRPTIYQRPFHQAIANTAVSSIDHVLLSLPLADPQPLSPSAQSPSFQTTTTSHQPSPQLAMNSSNESTAPKEMPKPPILSRSPLKVSKVAPPLIPASASDIDFDMYKDCLLEGEDWANEIKGL